MAMAMNRSARASSSRGSLATVVGCGSGVASSWSVLTKGDSDEDEAEGADQDSPDDSRWSGDGFPRDCVTLASTASLK